MQTDVDGLYTDYVETTVDPGWTIFIVGCIICACTLLALPCTVACGRSCQRRYDERKEAKDAQEQLASTFDDEQEEQEEEENDVTDNNNNNEGDAQILSNNQEESNQDDNDDDDAPPLPPSASFAQFAAFFRPVFSRSFSWLEEDQNATAEQDPQNANTAGNNAIVEDPTPLDAGRRRRRRGVRTGNLGKRRVQVARGMEEEGRVSVLRHIQKAGITENIEPNWPAARTTTNPNVSIAVGEYDVNATSGCKNPSPWENLAPMPPSPLPHTSTFANHERHHSSSESESESEDGQQPIQQDDKREPRSSAFSYFGKENVRKYFDFVASLAEYDNETKRLLRLALPFTLSAVIGEICEIIVLSIVFFHLGTEALVSYVMVVVIVGTTSEFAGGFVESVSSLASMAYGAGNNHGAGQYLQLCILLYVLFQIPFIVVWGYAMFDVMKLMGFDDVTAAMAQEFARIGVVMDLLEGFTEGYSDFLEVIEKEVYANVLGNIKTLVELGLVALVAIVFDANLIGVGVTMMLNMILFFFINVTISMWKGWIKPFYSGLFDSRAFKNRIALRQIFKTAVPLAFGSVMGYAEWEILTIFAAVLGPAEAASWAILSYVWDCFEAITEGIGDAAEVRCAYHLGKGRPEMAKRSAYKSIFLASIVAVLRTSVLYIMGEDLPTWLTPDPTLQRMIGEQILLIGLGGITMNMGMISWALIGSQARYRLATCIYTSCSWFIVVPLAAIVTIGIRLDLQGLTFSVVVGYAIAAMLLSTTLLLSDWRKHSDIIRAIHATTGEIDSSDSDSDESDGSVSSASSSSSSSSTCNSSSNSTTGSSEEERSVKFGVPVLSKDNNSDHNGCLSS